MRRLLGSGFDFLVDGGYLYLPLLFDPAIEREIQGTTDPSGSEKIMGSVVLIDGKYFVRSLNLHSLIENYEKIGKVLYDEIKSAVLQKVGGNVDGSGMVFGWKLIAIIFQVMPYFIKKNRSFARRRFGRDEILKLLAESVDIPTRDHERTNTFFDLRPLQEALKKLENLGSTVELPMDGVISSHELSNWVRKGLEAEVIKKERTRLGNELLRRQQLITRIGEDMEVLLCIAKRGSAEIDGFGFARIGNSDDYVIYKRTGEYILKDYYGRSYLFPDCRVAVSTFSPFKPVVMEKYKHPFLYAHSSGQEICMQGFNPPQEFSAENTIQLLEGGINALLYGYDSRRRNGYHSLEKTREYVKSVEFDDYRI